MGYSVKRRRFIFYKDEPSFKKYSAYLKTVNGILKRNNGLDISSFSKEDKLKILDKLERMALVIRGNLEIEEEEMIKEEPLDAYKYKPVKIKKTKESLHIFTPLTTIRNVASSSYIASCVVSALQEYEQEHSRVHFSNMFKDGVEVTQIRKISKAQWTGKRYIKDNNNEDSKIINAIMYDVFLKTDGVSYIKSFTNKTEVVNDESVGMEFVIKAYKG